MDKVIKSIKSFGQIYDKFNIDSLILKNKDELDKFYDLFSNKIKIYNMKLLYRSSRDGLTLENLKDKINNKSNLIFLFLIGNIRIFGSFAKAKIEVKHNFYIKDEDAFMFSLNNNKIYKILVPENAIGFYNGDPTRTGNNGNTNGIWLNSGKIHENFSNNPKIYDFQKKDELTEGSIDIT